MLTGHAQLLPRGRAAVAILVEGRMGVLIIDTHRHTCTEWGEGHRVALGSQVQECELIRGGERGSVYVR